MDRSRRIQLERIADKAIKQLRREQKLRQLAERDAEYRETLAKGEQAAAAAGVDPDPRVPTSDLLPIHPPSGYLVGKDGWPVDRPSPVDPRRTFPGGAPGLGKRR